MKALIVIAAVILLLAMFFFRVQAESGMVALERCRDAVGQAKSWTIESTFQQEGGNLATHTTREKVSCPDDYEYFSRSRTPDDVISEQDTIHTHGVSYVENADGKWEQSATAGNSQIQMECGKGPTLIQMTVFHAIGELPHRRAGKIEKGQLQTIGGVRCQEWNVDYGNEWPQATSYTVCIDSKTRLPRRISYAYPGVPHDFTGWNSTTVEPPAL